MKDQTFPELSQQEVRAALCVGEDHTLWRAIHQLIKTQSDEAVFEALDPDNQGKPHMLNYYAGAAAHLLRLQDFLVSERNEGLKSIAAND